MQFSRQAGLLTAIAAVDLVTTVHVVCMGGGDEANPLMAPLLAMGLGAFVVAKVALTAGPIAILEWARQRRPQFVRRAVNGALAAYVLLYCAGVVRANVRNDPLETAPDPRWSQHMLVIAAKRRALYKRVDGSWVRTSSAASPSAMRQSAAATAL